MRKLFLCCSLCALLTGLSSPSWAANAKIDLSTYICAELVALTSTSPDAPLFEALQLDGYAAAAISHNAAVPHAVAPIMTQVLAICQAKPTERVVDVWKFVREELALPDDGPWQGYTTICKTYNQNEEEGSGFPVWLDGFNRQLTGEGASILKDNETFQSFLKACSKKPEALMLDVLRENAK